MVTQHTNGKMKDKFGVDFYSGVEKNNKIAE